MSRTLLPALAVLAAGAAGAAGYALFTHREPPSRPDDANRQIARLADDVRQLTAAWQRLEAEVRLLSVAPPFPASESPRAASEPDAAPATDTAAAPSPSPAEERIDEKVRSAVAASREAELERIGQRFSTIARRREAATLDRFAQSSGLSPYQREEMEKALDRRREAVGAFFRTLFGGGETDPADIREKVADVQRETDEALRSLLSPEQFDEWKKLDEAALRNPFGPPMRTPR